MGGEDIIVRMTTACTKSGGRERLSSGRRTSGQGELVKGSGGAKAACHATRGAQCSG